MTEAGFLLHPLLAGFGHGFGTRGASEPPCHRPRQVHGSDVAVLGSEPVSQLGAADAVIALHPGTSVGVVTADCVPILVAHPSGAVAAVHAGWRGLARGVISSALDRLESLGISPRGATAVLGPYICSHHYEVDAPVLDALEPRFGATLASALRESRPGHWFLGLGVLAAAELQTGGIAPERIGTLGDACTFGRDRFVSRRRDGGSSARLLHYITARTALDSPEPPA